MSIFTKFMSCANKNLSGEQISGLTLISDIDNNPVEKYASVFNFQGGWSQVRKTNLDKTAFVLKASKGNLLGWNIINPNGSAIYVKFYDKAAASVNPATDVPVLTVMVPANSPVYVAPNAKQAEFATAMSMRACTGLADTDDTNPGTSIHINAFII